MAFSIGRAGGLDEEHEDHQWLGCTFKKVC